MVSSCWTVNFTFMTRNWAFCGSTSSKSSAIYKTVLSSIISLWRNIHYLWIFISFSVFIICLFHCTELFYPILKTFENVTLCDGIPAGQSSGRGLNSQRMVWSGSFFSDGTLRATKMKHTKLFGKTLQVQMLLMQGKSTMKTTPSTVWLSSSTESRGW